jgi:3-dehydroquinate synthase
MAEDSVDTARRENPNIVLTGFMGTGKTTVGRELARLSGLGFVDADALLEERLGLEVQDIFRLHGEARFRQEEKQLARELSELRGTVIATGGGMVVDPESRRALESTGELVCLRAKPETIVERVRTGSPRPLLAGRDEPSRIKELLASREEVYGSIAHAVETEGLSPAQIAKRILGGLCPSTRRITVEIPGGDTYPVLVGRGLLAALPLFLSSLGARREVFVVTDSNVHALHAGRLREILLENGFNPEVFSFPAGEQRKSLETVTAIHSFLASNGAQRDSLVIGFGGGVTGDLSGFAASTYMRGIPLVHVPTTLMAQVDSSIGGKTGVNMPQAKNLIGTFYQPRMVIADPELLSTLPTSEIRCGIAEMLKTAIIEGEDAFQALDTLLEDALEKRIAFLEPLITRCAGKKAQIVSRDPFEKGERRVLNLGHTFGHALEKAGNYSKIPHGEAVAAGIGIAASLSARLGKMPAREAERITAFIDRAGLPSRAPRFVPQDILEAALLDKKAKRGRFTLVLPARIGDIEIVEDIEPRVLGRILEEIYEKDSRPARGELKKAR